MAIKGNIAKQQVEDKIIAALGKDFICVQDKKIYCWAQDGDERIQVAISMTCPKNFVGENDGNSMNFDAPQGTPDVFTPAQVTTEETENIRKLLSELGL